MKQNLLLKTALLFVALFCGASSSWADNVSIPQEMGSYIVLGDNSSNFASYVTTHTGCTLDSRLKKSDTEYVTVGTSSSGATLTLNVTATTAGDYVFGFKTGSQNGASTVAISMLKSGESTPINIATSEVVTQDGNWDPNVVHNFYVGALEAADYTITLTITNTSGGYSGNFGQFYFHTVTQYDAMPLAGSIADESTHIDLSDGTFYNCQYNNDKVVSGLDNGGYMDNVLVYNTAGGYYKLLLNIKDYKAEGTLKATIYPFGSDTKETDAIISITSAGDKEITWPDAISPGLKRLRFDFTGEKNGGTIFNYQKVTTVITKYSLNEAWNYSPIAAAIADVELTRSITAGKWSTIVLPFDLTAAQVTSTFGTNVKVAELVSGDTEKLTFNTVTTMNANKPYAILISSTDHPSNFSEATINGVTIVSGTPTQDILNWDFVGTYTDDHIPTGSYFFQNNQLFYAETSGNHIKPFRAYFRPDGVVGVRGFVGFSVDGQTTGIHSTLYDSTNKGDGKIYSLSGQIVTAPQKGVVYIVDGKKVIFNK